MVENPQCPNRYWQIAANILDTAFRTPKQVPEKGPDQRIRRVSLLCVRAL
jgi:hypothetical protein